MKKILKILTIIILVVIITGCNNKKEKKEKLSMICTNKVESFIDNIGEEDIRIEFKESKKTTRIVTVVFKEEDDKESILKALKQNYCNSEIKENYNCRADIINDEIVLVEESTSNNIMGIKEDKTNDEYRKILEDKGFKCNMD